MRSARWAGVGLIVTILVIGALSMVPASATGLQSLLRTSSGASSSNVAQPDWNSGNLCSSIQYGPGAGDVSCVSDISNSPFPLWYNFSGAGNSGAVANVTIYGSHDCVNMNFKGFYEGDINITIFGSDFSCPSSGNQSGNWSGHQSVSLWNHGEHGGGYGCAGSGQWNNSQALAQWGGGWGKQCAPGVNIAVNSEKDTVNLVQSPSQGRCHHGGGGYSTNVTIYSRQTFVNASQTLGSYDLNTTITYIGITAGFGVCPSGVTAGVVHWAEASYGSRNTFNTIFVDGLNAKHLPPNYPYSTEPLAPPDGYSYGWYNLYGNETTTTAPPGSCQYLGA